MNRRARILLIVLGIMATVLILLAAFQNRAGGDRLDLPALADVSVFDSVQVARADGLVSVTRSGRDWKFMPPEGALADPARVEALLVMFASGLRSDIHSDVGGDPAAFGLDPASAIRVTVSSAGRVIYDVEIGAVQTFADRPPDTFVRLPGEQSVFRVSGRDLRAPFASGKYSLRSTRLFAFNTADVVGLEFFNPSAADPRDRRVVLAVREGTRGIAGQEVMSRAWAVVEPGGVNPGRINVLAARLAGLSVESWHDELPAGVVIDETSPGVVVRLSGGGSVRVAVSAVVDGVAWASSGAGIARLGDVEAAVLSSTVADIRDPSLLAVAREDIESVQIRDGESGYTLTRRGGRFEVKGQPAIELDRSVVESFLAGVAGLTATRVVGAAGGLSADAVERELLLLLSGGRSIAVRFGPAGQSGLVPAMVEGDADVFLLESAVADAAVPELDLLRRKNILTGGPESIRSITIIDPEGRRTLLTPPAAPGQQWRMVGPDGSEASSPAVTGLAGTVMSMSVRGFLPDVPAASVRADRGTIVMTGRGFDVRLKVSGEVRGGHAVCAVADRTQFSGQGILIPLAAVEAVMSVTGSRPDL